MLVLAVLIGCINHLWIKLPPAIGMLLGSLVVSLLIVSSDHVFHLHVMRWFRGTLDDAHLPRVFLNAVLALLLFAGSLHVDVAELGRRRRTILILATASVIISATAFGWAMYYTYWSDRDVGAARLVHRARCDPGAHRRRRGREPAATGKAAAEPARHHPRRKPVQ